MNKNRIRGLPGRTSERVIAKSRAIKGREGKSGGDAAKPVVEPGNLKKALARVRRNRGAPGVRRLGVPTVLDRFIQQAVMQVLQEEWDPGFSDASYGFRPGRSAHQAVRRAQEHILAGFDIIVDLDLEKFFDRVNHDILMGLVAKRVMASVTNFLARRLKLTVNAAKSAVDRPSARAFLAFSFTARPTPQRVISPKALARFKLRVRELTRRTTSVRFTRLVEEVSRYLVGWRGYFGFCEDPFVLLRLDQWTRRRLRAVVWKHGRTRFAALRRRGVSKTLAAKTASSAHGPWRVSLSPALCIALPNAFFDRLGLASVAAGHAA